MKNERRTTNDERRILITAGPTREYIDPVRYISNDSSGQMGFALAGEAAKLGFKVTLVAGPVSIETPRGVRRIDVVSARGMQKAVLKYAKRADVVIMAAAVADWRPKTLKSQKIKKTDSRKRNFVLPLIENPDILAGLGRKKRPGQILVGFALETSGLLKNARKKLVKKNCDWIVANSTKSIGAGKSSAVILSRTGKQFKLPETTKQRLAGLIMGVIARSDHQCVIASDPFDELRALRKGAWQSLGLQGIASSAPPPRNDSLCPHGIPAKGMPE